MNRFRDFSVPDLPSLQPPLPGRVVSSEGLLFRQRSGALLRSLPLSACLRSRADCGTPEELFPFPWIIARNRFLGGCVKDNYRARGY